MPFCPDCGAKVSENAGFCPKCGGRLAAVEQTVKAKSRGKLAGIIVGCVIAIIVLVVILTHVYGPNRGVYLIYQADLSQVAVGSEAQAMEEVRDIIENRIDRMGVPESVIRVETQEGYYSISIQLPGFCDMEGAKNIIGRTGLLDFREQVVEGGNTTWVIATAIGSDGQDKELTGKYLKPNASVVLNPNTNAPEVAFEWDAEGAVLFKNITTRNLNKPIGIFLDNELVSAPTVQVVIEAKGVIEGDFTLSEANTLAIQLNSGAMPVSLGRWVQQGNSRVFEANVPLHEELVTLP